MPVVSAKPIRPLVSKRHQKREMYAEVCYYYSQYKLEDVEKMPARDVFLLLKIARKQEAKKMFNLVQIAAAPHTKKGEGVKKLSDNFQKEYEK